MWGSCATIRGGLNAFLSTHKIPKNATCTINYKLTWALDWWVKEYVFGLLLLACLRHAEIHTPDHLSAVLSVSRAPSPGCQKQLWRLGGGSGRRLRSGGGGRGMSGVSLSALCSA